MPSTLRSTRIPRRELTRMFSAYVEAIKDDLSENARTAGLPQHMIDQIESTAVIIEEGGGNDDGDMSITLKVGSSKVPARMYQYGGKNTPYEIHPVRARHLKFFWPGHEEEADPAMGSEGKLYKQFDDDGFLMNYVTHPGHPPDRDLKPFILVTERLRRGQFIDFAVMRITAGLRGTSETI